jgi:hypothetical protein
MCKEIFQLPSCEIAPTTQEFSTLPHVENDKTIDKLLASLHSCQTKKRQLWKLKTHDIKKSVICINYAYCLKRLLNFHHYSTQKHYGHINVRLSQNEFMESSIPQNSNRKIWRIFALKSKQWSINKIKALSYNIIIYIQLYWLFNVLDYKKVP